MDQKTREWKVPSVAVEPPLEARLSMIKAHRRGTRARMLMHELGWLALIVTLLVLLLAQYGALARG